MILIHQSYPVLNFLNGGRTTQCLPITQCRPILTAAKSPLTIESSSTIVLIGENVKYK